MTSQPQPRILIVEDHLLIQKVLGLLLHNLAVASDCAANGRDAVEAAQPNCYALILMDIMLPGMDGFEAAFAIRKREFGLGIHTPIMDCTALNQREAIPKYGQTEY